MQPLISNDTVLQYSLYGLFICLLLELLPYMRNKLASRLGKPTNDTNSTSEIKASSSSNSSSASTSSASASIVKTTSFDGASTDTDESEKTSTSSSSSSGSSEAGGEDAGTARITGESENIDEIPIQPLILSSEEEVLLASEGIEITAEELSKEMRFSQLIAMNLGNVDTTVESIQQMMKMFPSESVNTILRFLIARKGNVKLASDMLEACCKWRTENLPVDLGLVAPAFKSKCMFIHGNALDGTPALYFRGSLYDKNGASCESYVFASVLTIETALRSGGVGGTPAESITVLVHTSLIPGAPNASADITFIKAFVKVLSDNFPERLNKLIIYPFPFFGRAIWMVVRPFLDPRTADKVVLIPGGDYETNNTLPTELLQFVDPKQVPKVCGGQSLDPIKYIM